MDSSARPKVTTGGNRLHSLTKQMALEAADMEARLASLRAAMVKEKTKREAALASAGAGGAIWNHGTAATKGKGAQPPQQTAPARTIGRSGSNGSRSSSSAGTTANSSRTGSATRAGATAQSAAQLGAPRAPALPYLSGKLGSQAGLILQEKTSPDRLGTGPVANSPDLIKPQAPRASPIAAAVAADPRSHPDQPSARADPEQGYATASSSSSRPHVDCKPGSSSNGAQNCEGIGTSEGDDGLLGGGYDEAASRNSFLEALNEWRRAGKADTSCTTTASSSTEAGTQSLQSAGKAPAMSAMDVQTDSRGLSVKPNETSSICSTGTAGAMSVSSTGNAVGGSYFLKMLARNSSSSRTACADRPDEQPSFVRQPTPQDIQQHDQQQHGAAHGSSAGAISLKITAGPANLALHDAAEDDELDSSKETLPGFDAWLQTTEQHAEQATTSSSGDRCGADTVVASDLCARRRSGDGHQQEMQQLLARLEHLEDQQRAVAGAGSDNDRPQAVVQREAGGSSSGVVCVTAGLRLPDAIRLPVGSL